MAVPARKLAPGIRRRGLGARSHALPTSAPPPAPRRQGTGAEGRRRASGGRRARRAPFLFLSGLVVATMLVLLASAQALVAQGAFRLDDLSERADRLEVETDVLRLRVAELSTPDRIAAAGRRAGLVRAEEVHVLGGERP